MVELTEEECEIFWDNKLGLSAMIKNAYKAGYDKALNDTTKEDCTVMEEYEIYN